MRFEEVDDGLWGVIKPFIAPQKPRAGRPRADLKRSFNGVLYVLITGCKWSDLPRKYGLNLETVQAAQGERGVGGDVQRPSFKGLS